MNKKMKKLALLLAVVISAVVLFNWASARTSIKTDEDLVGKQVEVDWSTLNLRNEAGDDGDIIGKLHEGQVVTLTGRTHEPTLGGEHKFWLEVETSANGIPVTGWVYAEGVDLHGRAG